MTWTCFSATHLHFLNVRLRIAGLTSSNLYSALKTMSCYYNNRYFHWRCYHLLILGSFFTQCPKFRWSCLCSPMTPLSQQLRPGRRIGPLTVQNLGKCLAPSGFSVSMCGWDELGCLQPSAVIQVPSVFAVNRQCSGSPWNLPVVPQHPFYLSNLKCNLCVF